MDKYFRIFSKYPDISAEEQKALEQWFADNGHEGLWKQLSDSERILQDMNAVSTLEKNKEQYWHYLLTEKMGLPAVSGQRKVRVLKWGWYLAAASVVLVLSIGGYWWLGGNRQQPVSRTEIPKPEPPVEVVPGSFKARLTLSDGRVVVLDSAALGTLATQGHTSIENKKGQLVYGGKAGADGKKVLYNTLTTGRGESYSVVLADGTRIWLNAASSVRYPLSFPGSDRKVEVFGEAYFEVAHNAYQPFIARVNGMDIKVLGTVFNVHAYGDEHTVTTTLLEGKVQLTKEKHTEVLAPGWQAELLPSGRIQVKKDADLDKAVGWKNGLFVFKGDNVQTVMHQLSRWYDVNVVYKGVIQEKFTGIINRDLPVSVVLEMLERSTVHFQIEGRTITVTP